MIEKPNIQVYVVHHTAVSLGKAPTQLYAVNRYHRDKDWGGGWKQKQPSSLGWWVGYNYFIDGDGELTKCREIGEETLAQTGLNCDTEERCTAVSICLAGNFNNDLPNAKQRATLRKLISELEEKYPGIRTKFHRDVQANRTCPGNLYTHDYHKNVVLKEEEPDNDDLADQLRKIEDILRKLLAYLLQSNKA